MSIYSRSYMRDEDRPSGGSFDALKWILITLGAVFVVQKIVALRFGADVLALTLGLSVDGLLGGGVHRLLTYSLLHDTIGFPLHLLFNGLIIFFAGRALQMRMGGERLLELFLFAALCGGIFWSLVQLLIGSGALVVGASGAALGLITVFAFFYWNETIRLIFIVFPIALEGKKIFYIILGFQAFLFLASELSQQANSRVAYSAHLGGIAGGYLYYRHLVNRQTLWSWLRGKRRRPSTKAPAWQQRGEAAKRQSGRFRINLKQGDGGSSTTASSDLRAEVDRILDKINAKGFGSLTEAEKRLLDRARDRLR